MQGSRRRPAGGQRHRLALGERRDGGGQGGQGAGHRAVLAHRVAVLRRARRWTTASSRRRSPARSRARCTSGRWPRSTACRSSCTPTTAPRSCCPGSTASSRRARSTSRATASRSSARTCSTSPRSPLDENIEISAQVPDAHRQDEHDAGDRAGRHRRRGGRRRQLRRRSLQALHQPRRRAAGLRRARPDRQLHHRGGVRQHPRRVRARQRQAQADHPARLAEVRIQDAAQDRSGAGQLRVPRRLGLDARGDPRGGLATAW